ncbi:glycosyltransferase [Saccharopolyspora rhizosphaerae]|uniref:glycosyltransferase n=1 Tax=Saccharopolyspora rhizosphaerae TaxID=2492662 RepID=UPI0013151B54|nr:glycosyltransferase family 2 protein [Saccharopolyspora rhizosphaerae]
MEWLLLFLVFGINVPVWSVFSILRCLDERRRPASAERSAPPNRLRPADVAVLIPAHDEELGITLAINSTLRLVPAVNVHVLADGCRDRTAEIAAAHGVRVLELNPGRGKAGAIEEAIEYFQIIRRFAAVLLVDADTEVGADYLTHALPMFDDPRMAAIAGYVRPPWSPEDHTFTGRLLTSYRARLWTVMQWMRYGQSWRNINVVPIAPGFASMYRTSVLPKIDLNPPGLIIEDFNMTFELHHKRLGKVGFSPSVNASTEDPDNLPDYYRQVRRWSLGLWQTLRRHGVWFGRFWFATGALMLEVVTSSVLILGIVAGAVLLLLVPLTGGWALDWPVYREVHAVLAPWLSPFDLAVFLFLPDYLVTCVAAVVRRRPSLLIYGVGFLFVRAVEAVATMWTFYRMWRTRSSGRWTSPRPPTPPEDEAEGLPALPAKPGARRVVLLDAVRVAPVVTVVALGVVGVLNVLLVAGLLLATVTALTAWHRPGKAGLQVSSSGAGDPPPGRV